MSSSFYVPPGGPPQAGPSKEIYAKMGAENYYRLAADFYAEIERSEIRSLFSEDLPEASKKIADFLIGVTGGPPLYRQKHGEPMMRARHLGFAIDEKTRQVWLSCFKKVLVDGDDKYNFPPEYMPGFIKFLEDFSKWMVNMR